MKSIVLGCQKPWGHDGHGSHRLCAPSGPGSAHRRHAHGQTRQAGAIPAEELATSRRALQVDLETDVDAGVLRECGRKVRSS